MAKKILFINPWIADFTAYDLWARPLGLLYVMQAVKEIGIEISFIDCTYSHSQEKSNGTAKINYYEIEKPEPLKKIPRSFKIFGISIDEFEQRLKSIGSVDAVFITSMMTYWYPGIQIVVERLRKNLGNVPIVIGGIYATLLPEHAKQFADMVVQGEGETKINKILDKILNIQTDINPKKIRPYFEALNDKKVLPFLTSRGCPFKCSYCASSIVSEFREKTVDECIEELEYIKKSFDTEHIAFYDDALLFDKENRIKPLLREIIKRNISFNFHTPNGLHIGSIDEELVLLMKKANFKTIRLSLESSSKDFLEKTGSNHKISDFSKVVEILKKAGYTKNDISAYVLIGLPYQTSEEVKDTIDFVGSRGIKVSLAYFSPVPGTVEYKKMKEEGFLPQNEDPILHNKIVFPYFWSKITPDELKSIKELQRKINSMN